MANDQAPSIGELILEAARGELARSHVALPARVVSYDQVTQTCAVQPDVRARYRTPEGESVAYQLPQITSVPVAFPAGGGCSITWPLAADDEVLLVICERSLDEWKSTAGSDCTPRDKRRFDLTDAVAIPGLRSPGAPLTEVANALVIAGAEIRLGSITAADFVALASLVDNRLGKLQAAVDGHMHATAAAGPPVTGTPIPGVFPVGALASVAATKVKAE